MPWRSSRKRCSLLPRHGKPLPFAGLVLIRGRYIHKFGMTPPTYEMRGDPAGLQTVMLDSPSSFEDRLAKQCERSRGLVYGVGLLGVPGARSAVGERTALLPKRLTAIPDLPVVMG